MDSGTDISSQLEASGLSFERRGMLDEAAEAYDRALRSNPSSRTAAEGRARIALSRKEPATAEHCSRALAFHSANPDLQFVMIMTAALEIGPGAIPLLEDFVHHHPDHIDAFERLAELRAEAGAGDEFVASYLAALRDRPHDKPLSLSYWKILSRSGRHLEALEAMESARSLFEDDRDFRMLEVWIASHAGLNDRMGRLLEQLDDKPDAQLARGQHALQTGEPAKAAALLHRIATADPDNHTAWALLELAWRLIGDPEHEWLAGQPHLYGVQELDLTEFELAEIADRLRTLHRSRSQPVGQSVRGGTQTSGDLFTRPDPEIVRLIMALRMAIRQFFSRLPAQDDSHPLLRFRDRAVAFGPSWSIRLTGGGFHAAHFHPGGILSSACYIALPESMADNEGCLEIGRPPPELKLDLSPLATFRPTPGKLALFPSYLFHGTSPFEAGERLTVAFDIVPQRH